MGVLSPTMPVICRLATFDTRSSTLVARDFDKASPPIAEIEIGTVCTLSERLAAVTTISPGAAASGVCFCVCAIAGLTIMPSVIANRLAPPIFRSFITQHSLMCEPCN